MLRFFHTSVLRYGSLVRQDQFIFTYKRNSLLLNSQMRVD